MRPPEASALETTTVIDIPISEGALVVLIGPSGAGKSSFAAARFRPTEIVSSDRLRKMVADDDSDQDATRDAFDLLGRILRKRLARGLTTVVDSTAAKARDRKSLLKFAADADAPAIAIVLDVDPEICSARNRARPGRGFGPSIPAQHSKSIRGARSTLADEGFAAVHWLDGPDAVAAARIVGTAPAWDRRCDVGPFDVIGDVHGCAEELIALLTQMGYAVELPEQREALGRARHPQGRRLLFLGDLCDRGPRNLDALRLAMGAVDEDGALMVIGNHDDKLRRWLAGRDVTLSHGLADTVAELKTASQAFRARARWFLEARPEHLILDRGRLVAAHAGLAEALHGGAGKKVRSFALFGDVSGERDADGLPIRRDWAAEYRGDACVLYGHVAAKAAAWRGRTLCLDTGCCFGGALTALRWPERDMISIPASRTYSAPPRPLPDLVGPPMAAVQD